MKIISMSLYGESPMYVNGALHNVQLAREYYPDWTLRIYCASDVDTARLQGCQVVKWDRKSYEHEGMFWRFRPAWEHGVEYVIFRDADSRLNPREAEAVKEWIASSALAHAMHDHLYHVQKPLQGGMWGVRGGILSGDAQIALEASIGNPQKRIADMRYLQKYVYPEIKHSTIHHTTQPIRWLGSRPFPEHEAYDGFVGQQFDDENKPIWPEV